MKSGLGSASVELGGGVVVGALVAANPLGDVLDPATGSILAGVRNLEAEGLEFADTRAVFRARVEGSPMSFGSGENTVIGVVACNARLSKRDCTKLAQMAQVGVARTVRPAHTMFDGDALFALATGEQGGAFF
jgi:L-aminopeptidase/D-esterase-like protein